ncbi:MAG TPA: tetratricopeptide repeat protein [Terriglobales bacterium]|nr:tetratricopeptide repeat protein [Terriglobales bacterium]
MQAQRLDAALDIVAERLGTVPDDYEAHGWRGRLLAWKGRWFEAESEYKLVLEKFPDDVEILTALSDVLVWQHKYADALQVLNHATSIAPSDPEVLSRQARVLTLLGRTRDARSEYQQLLKFDPDNKEAKANLLENARYELRLGNDTDFFNFANNAETQNVTFTSHWNQRYATTFGLSAYQRFGQDAVKFLGSGAMHVTAHTWASIGGAVANDQGIVPTNEAFFEVGHGFHLDNRWLQGLESSYQQHWYWYTGAHVLALCTTQIAYLPHRLSLALAVTGARTGFVGPAGWEPSGWVKPGFPVLRRVNGYVLYGVGTESFAQIDQVEQFAAHTYGGGLRYRFTERQDVESYVAHEDRSHGQTDTTLGFNYGIRF